MDEAIFFKKKLNKNNFLIYNSEVHLPAIFNKQGKQYLELIYKYKKVEECLKFINILEHKQFIGFFDYVKDIGFLKTKTNINFDELIPKPKKGNKSRFYFHLTDRCNLKCNYCYNENKRINLIDISFENWKIIIDKISKHIGTILITGGEPFLYNDFDILLQYLRNKCNGIRIEAFSNGNIDFNKSEKYLKIFKLLDKITLSCDNISNNDHDRIGFCLDTFQKNIKWINKNGFEGKTYINSVIGRNKLKEVKAVEIYAKMNNLHFSYALRLPNTCSDKRYLPSINEYKNIIYNNHINSNNPTSNNKIPLTLKCSAATSTFSIDSQGNCFPCQNFHYPEFNMGNLLQDDFNTILLSEKVQKIKKHTVLKINKCNTCNLKFVCSGGCIADTYKLYGNIEEHPKILCPYYKIGAIHGLINTEYEEE